LSSSYCAVFTQQHVTGATDLPVGGDYAGYLSRLLRLQPYAPSALTQPYQTVIAGTRVIIAHKGDLSSVGADYFTDQETIIAYNVDICLQGDAS